MLRAATTTNGDRHEKENKNEDEVADWTMATEWKNKDEEDGGDERRR